MSIEREIFLECLELPKDQQDELIADRCGADLAMRSRLEEMLELEASRSQTGDAFLESPLSSARRPPAVRPETWVGREIGPFTIRGVLGVGGTSAVFRAIRTTDLDGGDSGHEVALKLLLQAASDSDEARLFARERAALRELDHPSIARLFESGTTEEGLPYLVMEKIDGASITDFCDRNRKTIDERITLLIRVCAAVEIAHRNLVLHRDLKPGNVLVTENGDPKLLDFGIAKLLGPAVPEWAGATTTLPSERRMTVNYASPEQIAGLRVTTTSDVYSLGVILHELLTGLLPHDWSQLSAREVATELERRPPPQPSARNEGWRSDDAELIARRRATRAEVLEQRLRGDLDAITARALEPDPARRYPSVTAFRADLEATLQGRPVIARPPTFVYLASRFVRRHRVVVSVCTAALVFLVATGVLVREQAARAERERQTAEAATDFLIHSLFERETGTVEVEKSLSLEELGRVERRARSSFSARPGLQARLLVVLAQLYRSHSDVGTASRLLEEVLANAELETFPAELVARARHYLAAVRFDQGRFEEAAELSRSSLDLRDSEGAGAFEVAESLFQLARALEKLGDYEQAELLAREALDLRLRVFEPGHPDIAQSWANLGSILDNTGRYSEAKEAFDTALEIARANEGEPGGREVAGILSAYLNVLVHLQLYEESEAAALESLAIERRLHQPSHPRALLALSNLAGVRFNLRRFDDSAAAFAEALELQRSSMGDDHPEVINTLANLGAVLNFAKRPAEAETYLAEAVALQRDHFGPGHFKVALGLRNLSIAHEFQGEFTAAETSIREALEIDIEALGEHHPTVAGDLHLLGSIILRQGRAEESAVVRARSVDVRRVILAEAEGEAVRAAKFELAKSLSGLAEALVEAERFVDAAEVAREAVEIGEQLELPTTDHRLARPNAALGYALARTGDPSGRELLRTSYDAVVAERGADYLVSTQAAAWIARVEELEPSS